MRAFGSALGTTVVTLGGLAGATLLVSTAGMEVVRRVVKHQEVGARTSSFGRVEEVLASLTLDTSL